MTAEAALRRIPRTAIRSDAWWVFPAVPLLAGAIAFAWILHAELQRLYGLTGSAWDFAYDQQVIWNISQGRGFYSTFARANLRGIHFELIFVVLAAVEKLLPSPAVRSILYMAGGWFLVGTGIVQQPFGSGGYTACVYYRWLVGLDPTLPLSPLTVLEALFRPYAVLVVAAIIAGTCLMPLFAPRWLLLAVPPYLP